MSRNHWENVYQMKAPDQVSWYQAEDKNTLQFMKSQAISLNANIIDVGSGSSIFIDELLEVGYKNLYVLDLSKTALEKTQIRIAEKNLDSLNITWLVDDICSVSLPQQHFDLWHDRAVFHFMTTEQQQAQYLSTLKNALKNNGYLIMSTFAEDGPEKCSGLTIQRYNIEQLHQRLGDDFHLIKNEQSIHITPWSSEQKFINTMWQLKR